MQITKINLINLLVSEKIDFKIRGIHVKWESLYGGKNFNLLGS